MVFSAHTTASAIVSVTNTGQSAGSYELVFKIDRVIIATRKITLAGGANRNIIFTFKADTAGEKYLEINGLSKSILVQETTPPGSNTRPAGQIQPAGTSETPSGSEKPASLKWPLILGVICSFIILSAAVFYFTRHKRKEKQG